MKRIKRSNKNRVVAGVFGGLGEYLDVDPVFLRLIGLLILLVSRIVPFLLVYFIAVLIIPNSEEENEKNPNRPFYKKGIFWAGLLLILFFIFPIVAFFIFMISGMRVAEESGFYLRNVEKSIVVTDNYREDASHFQKLQELKIMENE